MKLQTPVYIVSATRTAMGAFQGVLSSVPAVRLGAKAIQSAVERSGLKNESIEEVYMGNVLQAAEGQAPARQAMIYAGLSQATPAVTVNKVCGSGLQAILFAAKSIALGEASVTVAGGMESMSNVPYYLPQARTGYRMGDGKIIDGMVFDGLWDPYGNFHMGNAGEKCASEFKFTREAQDEFAKESFRRSLAAQKEGRFAAEITPFEVAQKKGDPTIVKDDEGPPLGRPDKMAALKPAFVKDGTITAANASSISDGASALVLASEATVKANKLEPLARIVGWAGKAQAPEWFTTAPAGAIENALAHTGLKTADIDLFEINEAFAVVTMAAIKQCNLDPAKVNVRGGAVSLGHPIGASGARIVTTLLYAMKDLGKKRGLATLCIGGGEALALVVERP